MLIQRGLDKILTIPNFGLQVQSWQVGAFSPLDIAGLQLWLKADAGLWQDSVGGTPAVADGDVVGAWEDQSGQSNDASQATTSKKPLLKTGIVNGRDVVRFDGADDWLKTGSFARSQPSHVFAVIQQISWTGEDRLWDSVSAVNGLMAYQWSVSPGLKMYSGAGLGDNSGLAIGTFGVLSCLYNGASSVLRINGNEQTGNAGANAGNGITLGAAQVLTVSMNGDFAELLVYDAALSTADRQAMETYLNARFAVY